MAQTAPITVGVFNNNGDSSVGSLGGAVTAVNADPSGGVITFGTLLSNAMTLSGPLSEISKNVTLEGPVAGFLVEGASGSTANLTADGVLGLQADSSSFQFGLEGGAASGAGGTGGGSFLTSSTLNLGSNSTLNLTGAEGNSGSGAAGGDGGSAFLVTTNMTLDSSTAVTLLGGAGGGGGTGTAGFDASAGGDTSFNATSVTFNSNSDLFLESGAGSAGGQGTVSMGGAGSRGGLAVLTMGDAVFASATTLSALGGNGGAGGEGVSEGGAGGTGGGAQLDSNTLSLAPGSALNFTGGTGGAGGSSDTTEGGDGGAGGSVSVVAVSATIVNGTVSMTGGQGGAGGVGITLGGAGGRGGGVDFGFSNLSFSLGSKVQIDGGQGGDGASGSTGGSDGSGGAVTWTSSGVTLLSSLTLDVQGGSGGNGTTGGNGGAVGVTLGLLNLGTNAALTIAGGTAYGIGLGGDVSFQPGTLQLGNGTVLTLEGGLTNGGSAVGGSVTVDSVSVSLGAGATLDLDGGNSYAALENLEGSGTVTVSGVTSGQLQLSDGLFSGTIGVDSLMESGPGTFILDGAATVSDGVTVASGDFEVGDNPSSSAVCHGTVQVNSGALLSGQGSVNGLVTNDGLVQPGSSGPGTLTVASYTQNADGTLGIFLRPSGQSSLLNVTGATQWDGTLSLEEQGAFGLRYSYVILDSGSPISGAVTSVTQTVPGFSATLSGTNAVTLTLNRINPDFNHFASTSNQTAVAAVLNLHLNDPDGAFFTKLNEIYAIGTGSVLDSLDGVMYTALPQVILDNNQFENSLLLDRLDQGVFGTLPRASSALVSQILSSDMSGAGAPISGLKSAGSPHGFWIQNVDSFGGTSATANVTGFNKTNYGFLAGYDDQFGAFTAGVAGGYLHTDLKSADQSDSTGVNGYQGMLYTNMAWGAIETGLVLGFGVDHFDSTRTLSLGSDVSQAMGTFNGTQWGGDLRIDSPLNFAGWSLKPQVGAQYIRLSQDAFTETGAGTLDLTVPAVTESSLRPYVGMEGCKNLKLQKGLELIPDFNLTLSDEVLSQSNQSHMTLAGASTQAFTIQGLGSESLLVGVGAGVNFLFNKQFNLFAHYLGSFSQNQSMSTVNGGLSLAF